MNEIQFQKAKSIKDEIECLKRERDDWNEIGQVHGEINEIRFYGNDRFNINVSSFYVDISSVATIAIHRINERIDELGKEFENL